MKFKYKPFRDDQYCLCNCDSWAEIVRKIGSFVTDWPIQTMGHRGMSQCFLKRLCYWSDPQYNARYPQCLLWFLKSSFSHENWRHPLNVSAWRLREGSQCFPVIFPRYSQVLPRLGRPRRLNHRAEVTSEQSRRKRSQRADVPTYPEGTF